LALAANNSVSEHVGGATAEWAMTSRQTALLIAVVLVGTGAAWYEHLHAAGFKQQIEALRARELSPESKAALVLERDGAWADLKRVAAQTAELQTARADLLKLRGEATVLRRETRGNDRPGGAKMAGNDPAEGGVAPATLATLASNVASLKEALQKAPAQQVPELCFLEEQDWIKAARDAKLDTDEDVVKSLSRARTLAKERWIPMLAKALRGFVEANNGQLPTALTQLEPYFDQPVEDSIFERYEIIKTGDSRDLKPGQMIIKEKDRLTRHDSVFRLGLQGWGSNTL
jgi:hypothetical protein